MRKFSFILSCSLILGAAVLPATTLRAEHFDIDLSVDGTDDHQEAHRDDYPPAEGRNRRPVFHAKTGESLRLQFLFTNINPHETLKRVGIRYYLIPVAARVSKANPTAANTAIISGNYVLDFKFKGKVGFKQSLRLSEPGRYLLRAESSNSGSDHEHFAAIDLDIH